MPDALSLIEQTDLTLFVVRCLKTNKAFAKQTLETLAINHKDKIHLILSDIPSESSAASSYGYGYGYGAGYGYGYGYGYGKYGKKRSKRYNRYAHYYYKLTKKEPNDMHNYYIDDDEV